MTWFVKYGSVRGAAGNSRPYRDALRSRLVSAWGDCANLVDFAGLADTEMIAWCCVPVRCMPVRCTVSRINARIRRRKGSLTKQLAMLRQ
jgi:hypothetical protein